MNFSEAGHWLYAMVDQDGQQYWGRMDYLSIAPIDRYSALDGFCDDQGVLNPALPRSQWDVTFTDLAAHTLVQTVVSYASAQALQQVVDMGLEQGLASTLERLDELLSVISK